MSELKKIAFALIRTWVWVVSIGCFAFVIFLDIDQFGWWHWSLDKQTVTTRLGMMAAGFGIWAVFAGPVLLFRYFYMSADKKRP
jgi:hypothetical protein